MRKPLLFFYSIIIVFSISYTSCKPDKTSPVITRDTTITPITAITSLVLDSNQVEQFISQQHMDKDKAVQFRNFYLSRNYQYTWFDEEGLTQQTSGFWNLYLHFVSFQPDSSLLDKTLQEEMQHYVDDSLHFKNDTIRLKTELGLTNLFFKYAQYAYAGKIDPAELQWHIPRKKLDLVSLLDSLADNKNVDFKKWEPVSSQYVLLRDKLSEYGNFAKRGGWDSLPYLPDLKRGKESLSIIKLKDRLSREGLFPASDSTALYDSMLFETIKHVRSRYGLNESGGIDKALINELNVPVETRISQILVNMERMRWLPKSNDKRYIVVNIPDFILTVFDDDTITLKMRVVVGKAGTSTVVFTNTLKTIVFAPYWNVPYSISKNEILPAIRRNKNYLANNNMEITGYSGNVPIVRQRPGGNNSLGKVKFLFPNSYNIYFHDTPAKSLFSRDFRAFSHGCIRLQEPFELAEYLLRDQPQWTPDSIQVAMNKTKETWVSIKQPIPVWITYFTAYTDNNNMLQFRNDVYGHDAIMIKKLFK